MNVVKELQRINQKELEKGYDAKASWCGRGGVSGGERARARKSERARERARARAHAHAAQGSRCVRASVFVYTRVHTHILIACEHLRSHGSFAKSVYTQREGENISAL